MLKRVMLLLVCVIALTAVYVIILFPEVESQRISRQIHLGQSKITLSLTFKRIEIQEEGWTPGVRRTGWWQWR